MLIIVAIIWGTSSVVLRMIVTGFIIVVIFIVANVNEDIIHGSEHSRGGVCLGFLSLNTPTLSTCGIGGLRGVVVVFLIYINAAAIAPVIKGDKSIWEMLIMRGG